jgi:spermidine synthase
MSEAQAANLAAIRERLAPVAGARDGVLFHQKGAAYDIVVAKKGRQVRLYFAAPRDGALAFTGVMSRIDVYQPLTLLGVYTQAMMLALLWADKPRRVYVAGFGGGRVPMVLHHFFPEVVVESTEIDPAVAPLAERFFGIACDARLRVFTQDAAVFLEACPPQPRYDIIMIDCYSGDAAQPDQFATRAFYDLCTSRLTPGGVVAANIDLADKSLREKLATFARAFPYTAQFNDGVANVVFGAAAGLSSETFAARVDALAQLMGHALPVRMLAQRLGPVAAP